LVSTDSSSAVGAVSSSYSGTLAHFHEFFTSCRS
jgi:hypothetical protein